MINAGQTVASVARALGIHVNTIHYWIKQLKKEEAPAVTTTEADTLNTEKPVHKPIEHDSTFGSSAQEGAQPVTEEV